MNSNYINGLLDIFIGQSTAINLFFLEIYLNVIKLYSFLENSSFTNRNTVPLLLSKILNSTHHVKIPSFNFKVIQCVASV